MIKAFRANKSCGVGIQSRLAMIDHAASIAISGSRSLASLIAVRGSWLGIVGLVLVPKYLLPSILGDMVIGKLAPVSMPYVPACQAYIV
jgi:hypothetical protein